MKNTAASEKKWRISLAGLFLYYCLPYRRKVIAQNMDQVFGESLSAAQKKQLAKAFYSHMATSIREALQLRFLSQEKLRNSVEVRGHQRMLDIIAHNKGVIVVTGHFGSWEFAPIGGVSSFTQFKGQFHFIRKTLGSKIVEKFLFRRYYQAGLNVIPKKNSLEKVCAALEQNHAVIFVLDQHASVSNRDGIAVEFFGKKAGTFRSPATLSRNTGVPVVPASTHRLPNGRHVLEFHEALHWEETGGGREQDLYHNTLRYNQALEKIVLAHPEQWMWLHKRWKL